MCKRAFLNLICLTLLSSVAMPVFADKEIKCPSIEYVKSNFIGTMNTIKRREPNTFAAESDNLVYDYDNHLYWITRTAYLTTAQDYDFNEAHKLAEASINNIFYAKTEYAEGYPGLIACTYLDVEKNITVYLVDGSIGLGVKEKIHVT